MLVRPASALCMDSGRRPGTPCESFSPALRATRRSDFRSDAVALRPDDSVGLGDGFADRHRRCLRHGSGRRSRRSLSPRAAPPLSFPAGSSTAAPTVMTMVVRFAQMLSCRFGLSQDKFRRPAVRFKSNCRVRHARCSSVQLRRCAWTRDDVPEHRASHSRPRFARCAVPTFGRTPSHFLRTIASDSATASPVATADASGTGADAALGVRLRLARLRHSRFPPARPAGALSSAARAASKSARPFRHR